MAVGLCPIGVHMVQSGVNVGMLVVFLFVVVIVVGNGLC